MCYPSSGSTEWFSVGSLTSLWCSFFLTLEDLWTWDTLRSWRQPQIWKTSLSESQRFEAALFSVCWSESTIMADTEGDGLCLIRNFSAFISHLFPVQRSQGIFFHVEERVQKAQESSWHSFWEWYSRIANPGITERQELRSEEKSGNICYGLHW